MQHLGPQILLSATDLVNFHECGHLTTLDLRALDDKSLKAQKTQPDEHTRLLFHKGNEFEAAYLDELKREAQISDGTVVEIAKHLRHPAKSAAATIEAMRSGVDIIYQATFLDGDLVGHADFLRKVPRLSALGDYSYEVIDTKLGRKPKASYVLQLAFYGDLLAKVQQLDPHAMHVVLGTREQVTLTCNEYSRYFRRLLGRFTRTIENASTEITTGSQRCRLRAKSRRRKRRKSSRSAKPLAFLATSAPCLPM
jgi:predicted RecB family nuclease